jgi:hypothetical protein
VAFQPLRLSRWLRKQLALVLPGGPDPPPITTATYTEAVNKFNLAATDFMEYARLLTEAQNAYQRWQKEIELVRLRREIDALKLVIPFLIEATDTCQVEYSSSGEAGGMPCRKPAVAQCADCGASICANCRVACCGDSFCDQCYHYHATHSCLKRPVPSERDPRAREFLSQGTRAS